MMSIIEPILTHVEGYFNSNSLIPWKEINEGNIICHEGITYEIAFKSVRKRAVAGHILESNQILYLRPVSQGENVVGEIDEDGNFSLMWNTHAIVNSTYEECPSTGIGYESWTEKHLDSLKEELNGKIEKIRSLLR